MQREVEVGQLAGEMGLDREALPHQSGVTSGFPGGTNSSKVASLSPGTGLLIMPSLEATWGGVF